MAHTGFKGDIAPQDAWSALVATTGAVLIDVRTAAEWFFVGGPDVTSLDKQVVQVEWQTFPGMARNEGFVDSVLALDLDKNRPLYFICRSGVRSKFAAEALAEQGYTTYNIADGFEGQLSEDGRRTRGGWRALGLPWRQT
ncbi:rhodanese-like domain-containing protein [Stutzerimonas sp. NM35]